MVDKLLIGRKLSQDHSEQRGLAVAVPAHETDPLPTVHVEGEVLEEDLITEGLGYARDLDHGFGAGRGLVPARWDYIIVSGPSERGSDRGGALADAQV